MKEQMVAVLVNVRDIFPASSPAELRTRRTEFESPELGIAARTSGVLRGQG